jgi:hypothetical protein
MVRATPGIRGIVLCIVLAGCSANDSVTSNSGGGAGDDGNAGNGGTAGNAGNAGTAGNAGNAGSGGSAGNAGSGGSAGSSLDQLLMPLAAGRVWSFEAIVIDTTRPSAACDDLESAVVGRAQTPEGEGWLYDPVCGPRRYIMLQTGDSIAAYSEDLSQRVDYMVTPVAEGTTWDDFAWQAVGSTTVPAGTFDDCWRRLYTPLTTEWIEFCRGVGLVRLSSGEDNRVLELIDVNF